MFRFKIIPKLQRAAMMLLATMLTFSAWSGTKTLTVYDGTATSYYVPINGEWCDSYLKCEFVIPSTELSVMKASEISQMTFYIEESAEESWGDVNFQVFMKEVDNTTLSAFTGTEGATIVYEGSLDGTQSELTIGFTTNFVYSCGNLLVGIYNTSSGSWSRASFYGTEVTGASVQGYSTEDLSSVEPKQTSFIPKTTFTYVPLSGYVNPLALKASDVTNQTATLSWTKPSDDVTGYTYRYKKASDDAWSAETNTTETSVTLTNLSVDTDYNFQVKALYGENASEYDHCDFKTEPNVYAPTSVTVSKTTAYTAQINWTDGEEGLSSWQISYSTQSGVDPNNSTPIDINTKPYTLTELNENTTYYIYVRAIKGEYVSAWTAATFTTPELNPTPTDVTVSDITSNSATANWSGYSENYNVKWGTITETVLSSYDFEGDDVSLTDFTNDDTYPWSIAEGNGGHCIQGKDEGIEGNGSSTFTYTCTFESDGYISFDADCGGEYYVIDDEFESFTYIFNCSFSIDGVIKFTENDVYKWVHYEYPVSTGTHTFEWTYERDNSHNEDCYYSIDNIKTFYCNYTWADPVPVQTSTYTISGLSPETQYAVAVQGADGESVGSWSDATLFTTLELNPTPTDVTVSDITSNSATANWSGYSENYNVKWGTITETIMSSYDFEGDDVSLTGFTNDGNNAWSIVEGNGGHCIRSGNAGEADSSSSISLSYSSESDCFISFDAECCGEEDGENLFDVCTFKIDGTVMFSYGANVTGWNSYTFPISAGDHTFTWTYSKDSSTDPTGDYFAIDNIKTFYRNFTWVDPVAVQTSTYAISGLSPETQYAVAVQGADGGSVGEWSSLIFFTTAEKPQITLSDDAADATNTDLISQYNNYTCDVTLSDRTLYRDGYWNTLCLPFDLTITGSVLDGATVMELDDASFTAGTLTLEFKTADAIKAGKPYIIKWTKPDPYVTYDGTNASTTSDLVNPTFTDVLVNSEQSAIDISGVISFIGTYEYQGFSADNNSILFLGGDNKLYYPTRGASIGACRAYFQLAEGITAGDPASASPIKAFVLNFDEDTNSISTIGEDAPNTSGWYSIDGRRLLEAPELPGMYIHEGQKVMIK